MAAHPASSYHINQRHVIIGKGSVSRSFFFLQRRKSDVTHSHKSDAYTIEAMVHGYHVFKGIWLATVDEELS